MIRFSLRRLLLIVTVAAIGAAVAQFDVFFGFWGAMAVIAMLLLPSAAPAGR